jgi:hypothetical protein
VTHQAEVSSTPPRSRVPDLAHVVSRLSTPDRSASIGGGRSERRRRAGRRRVGRPVISLLSARAPPRYGRGARAIRRRTRSYPLKMEFSGGGAVPLVLLVAVTALTALAPTLRALPDPPRPGRARAGFIPGVPEVSLPPSSCSWSAPPLLYAASFFTSLRDFRANLKPIGLLRSVSSATMLGVAAVAHPPRVSAGRLIRAWRRRRADRPDRRNRNRTPVRRSAPNRHDRRGEPGQRRHGACPLRRRGHCGGHGQLRSGRRAWTSSSA